MNTVIFDRDELDLIVEFAGCSLDASPGSNWVQEAGGLPEYICRIAKAIKKTGKSTSTAIAIAVSRVKKWATGAGVDSDTQAKAAKALAEWESKKAKTKAKKVKASRTDIGVLNLAAKSFNVDTVRRQFDKQHREARTAWRAANPSASYEDGPEYLYVREMWTDHIIASGETPDGSSRMFKYGYTVDGDSVTFGEPVEVKTQYVAVKTDEMAGAEFSDRQLIEMTAAESPCGKGATDVLLTLGRRPSALEQLLGGAG